MDRPLHIADIHNMSLGNFGYNHEYPHLVAEFPCKNKAIPNSIPAVTNIEDGCAAVQLCNVHNISFKRISLTTQTPNISGVSLQYASNVHIQMSITCSLTSASQTDRCIGILIHQGNGVEVHSSLSCNCSSGFVVHNTSNIHIINTTAMYNGGTSETLFPSGGNGLYLLSTNNAFITDTSTMYNAGSGMVLKDTANVTVINTSAIYNGINGIVLNDTANVTIFSMTGMHNGHYGMIMLGSTAVSIINIATMHNYIAGMSLMNTTNTSIINTTVMYNDNGMALQDNTRSISITNTTVMRNGYNGMCLLNIAEISIISTALVHNDYNGMYLQDSAKISMINMTVMDNGYHGLELADISKISIINTTLTHNLNSALLLSYATGIIIINVSAIGNGYNGISLYFTTDIAISNTTVINSRNVGLYLYHTTAVVAINLAVTGSGNEGIVLYSATETSIGNVSLMYNGWRREVTTVNGNVLSTADPTTLPAVIVLYSSSVHISECNISRNNVSAIKVISSTATASGNVTISNNRAIAGTAFILVQNSILKLRQDVCIQIASNHATNTGGAFYITNDLHFVSLDEDLDNLVANNSCFFNTEGSRSQRRFTFVNNSAGKGGDILYGGHVEYGLDGDWNCLLSFKNISNISQSGLSLITSDPSRVCLCNGSGQPDCLIVADPTPHSIYPGQSINISAVVVGQDFGTVAGSVYAQFLQKPANNHSPQLETGQNIQDVTQEKCNDLNYTIFPSGDLSSIALILSTNNEVVSDFVILTEYEKYREQSLEDFYHVHNASALDPLKFGHYPLYVNFSFIPCPVGFMLTTKPPFKCECDQLLLKLQGVKCYIQDQTIGRSGLVWVGTLKEDNGTVVASEYCSFDYCNRGDSNVTLSDPDSQCNYNHSGTLCGGCQPGLSLALGSAQCLQCSNKYLALLIPFALAGPAVVFFIKLLDLTISQGTVNGLIFYANIIKANDFAFLPQGTTNPLTLFIAWLNLDLGVETCFFNGLTAYTKTWLQFVFPIYIWSIITFVIISAKYSDQVAKVMGNNSVPVLATLFLLSYAKLLRTIITALSYTLLYSSQGHKAVWSADGNIEYLGPKHAPLFAVAVAVLLFLWLPYTLMLFLGQWLHMCNCRLISSILMKIKPFLDAHYGPLKGKHHYWFGALLLVRAVILLMSALIPTNHAVVLNFSISVFAIVLMYFGQIVYCNIIVAMFNASFFMNLALLGLSYSTRSGENRDAAAYILIGMAFTQFFGLILFKVITILKKSKKVMACLHKRRPAEDDWELYEQAALLREMESDTEEEDSDGSGSIESLPTY